MSNDNNGLRPSLESSVHKEIFKSEVRSWAKKIGVEFNSITIRPMTTKWASCSSKGNLTFDTDLLDQPAAFRRKTIVHELLHLKYPTHNKMFKALEKAYLEEKDYDSTKENNSVMIVLCSRLEDPEPK